MVEAYRYTSNKDKFDSTSILNVFNEDNTEIVKVLVKGGPAVKLTDEEYDSFKDRFNLRKASEQQIESAGEAVDGDPEKVAAVVQEKATENEAQVAPQRTPRNQTR